jgi:hypothetical protein
LINGVKLDRNLDNLSNLIKKVVRTFGTPERVSPSEGRKILG